MKHRSPFETPLTSALNAASQAMQNAARLDEILAAIQQRVRQQAHTHRGEIWVESSPEGGCRMVVQLPVQPSDGTSGPLDSAATD